MFKKEFVDQQLRMAANASLYPISLFPFVLFFH